MMVGYLKIGMHGLICNFHGKIRTISLQGLSPKCPVILYLSTTCDQIVAHFGMYNKYIPQCNDASLLQAEGLILDYVNLLLISHWP